MISNQKIVIVILCGILFFTYGCSIKIDSDNTPNNTNTGGTTQQSIGKRIFVLGDSLSAGYKLPYQESYPAQLEKKLQQLGYAIKVINGGESGDTSAGLKTRIERVITEAQSGDIALIVIGGNDGLQGLSTDILKQNIKDIIEILKSRNINTIIGGMQIPTNLGQSYRSKFESIYPQLAEETQSILIPFILSGVAGIPELNLSDGIHPNSTGQQIVAQTVLDTLFTSSLLDTP